jgi:hypothetical protein
MEYKKNFAGVGVIDAIALPRPVRDSCGDDLSGRVFSAGTYLPVSKSARSAGKLYFCTPK